MRTCPACGLENADDADFCSCGEYLRWEPTGFLPAVESADDAGTSAGGGPTAETDDGRTTAPGAGGERSSGRGGAPAAAGGPVTQPRQATSSSTSASRPAPNASPQPPPTPPPPPPAAPPASVSLTLRRPEDDGQPQGPINVGVEAGGRTRVLALVRNQSGIVDNYDLELGGLPREWWTITPSTVYLVPFGSAGLYEQEVQIELHPPRTSEAEARLWDLELIATSKAEARVGARAPFGLGILPFEAFETKLDPQRRSGRRKVRYEVSVRNRANAPAMVTLAGGDTERACRVTFAQQRIAIDPGQTAVTTMTARPPRQIWLGRRLERRLEVHTATGEEGERLIAEMSPLAGEKRKWFGRGKVAGVQLPQFSAPDVSIGPGGVKLRGPQVHGPPPPSANLGQFDLSQLRQAGAAAPPSAPLLPSQVVFSQRPWLPWWLAVALPILAVVAVMLFLLIPKTAIVPNVKGSPSVFAAQEKLEAVGLKLDPAVQKVLRPAAKPGSIVGQAPGPEKKVDKGAAVVVQVAVGSGSVEVPAIAGRTLPEAEKLLRDAGLVLGRTSVTPPDLKAKIASQVPAAKELVKSGTPVDVFYGDPEAAGKGGAAAAGGAGGGGEKDITVPDIEPKDVAGYSAKLADEGLVPQTVQRFDAAPKGTVFATEPPAGEKVAKGAAVRVLVSAGFPQLVFDDDRDILRIDGASGKPLDAVAKSGQLEKDPTWSADGTRVAFVGGGRIQLADVAKPDESPATLTADGTTFADPSFAPTVDSQVLAMSRVNSPADRADTDLCLGRVTAEGMRPSCIEDKDFGVTDASWSPDGKTILVPAVGKKGFGIVRYESKEAFSPRASDWTGGNFVTPLDETRATGVIDAAISPDGKRVALAANVDTAQFRLYLTSLDDLALEQAKPLPVQACKVIWRPDGREVVVVQAGENCDQETGQLFRISVDKTSEAIPLSAAGDNPAFQPLTGSG